MEATGHEEGGYGKRSGGAGESKKRHHHQASPSLSTVSERHPPTPSWSLFYGQHRRIRLLINGGSPSYGKVATGWKTRFSYSRIHLERRAATVRDAMKGNQPLTYSPMFCYLVRTSKIRFAVPVRPKDSYCGRLLTKKSTRVKKPTAT